MTNKKQINKTAGELRHCGLEFGLAKRLAKAIHGRSKKNAWELYIEVEKVVTIFDEPTYGWDGSFEGTYHYLLNKRGDRVYI